MLPPQCSPPLPLCSGLQLVALDGSAAEPVDLQPS
jgi:hypothetical protein